MPGTIGLHDDRICAYQQVFQDVYLNVCVHLIIFRTSGKCCCYLDSILSYLYTFYLSSVDNITLTVYFLFSGKSSIIFLPIYFAYIRAHNVTCCNGKPFDHIFRLDEGEASWKEKKTARVGTKTSKEEQRWNMYTLPT